MSKFLFYSLLHFWSAQLTCTNLPLQTTNNHIRSIPETGETRRYLLSRHHALLIRRFIPHAKAAKPVYPEDRTSRKHSALLWSTLAQCAPPFWP
ncbi:hypothetical protein BJV77DRAFT_1154763, partial [Russula vinacea]